MSQSSASDAVEILRHPHFGPEHQWPSIAGTTLVELLVSLSISSFLMTAAMQIYIQSRQAYASNDSIARIQETAQFAMDTIEADLRMAGGYGRNSGGDRIEGRSLSGNDNPNGLIQPAPNCGTDWAFDLLRPVQGTDNKYALSCAAKNGAQANSDVLTIRRTTVAEVVLEPGRLQVQSTQIHGEIIADGLRPAHFDPQSSRTYNLLINSYYVAADSTLAPGVPTLRRKTLGAAAGAPKIMDIEVAPGVENMQLQFGIDMDADNTVDRYVNPGNPIIDPSSALSVATAKVITARIWLLVRSVTTEPGIVDQTDYAPGNVQLGVPEDDYRRMLVSKTILLRNART